MARNGSAIAAAEAAMLIHCFSKMAHAKRIGSAYNSLLTQAYSSSDAELLACIAEELAIGNRLARDIKRAHLFVSKADAISTFKGSYAIGRLFAKSDRKLAIRLFQVGSKVGHIPSMVYLCDLRYGAIPLFGPIIKRLFAIINAFKTRHAMRGSNFPKTFWRYRDVSRPLVQIDTVFYPDRAMPFGGIEDITARTAGLAPPVSDGSHY